MTLSLVSPLRLGVVLLTLYLLPTVVAAQGEDTAVLAGQVRNGTSGAEEPGALEVTLRIFRGNEPVTSQVTTSDEGAGFTFPNIPTGDQYIYVLTTEYQGVPYNVQVVEPSEGVELVVYETTDSSEAIRVGTNIMMVTSADPEQQALTVVELISLENPGDRAFVTDPAQPGMQVLRFSLPPGYSDLSAITSLPSGHTVEVDRGFALMSPVPPGTHEVILSYQLAYQGGTLSFERSFPFGARSFQVLVPQEVGAMYWPGLTAGPLVTMEGVQFQVFEGSDLEVGASLSLELRGLSQPSLLQQLRRGVTEGTFGTVAIPAGVGAALLALVVWALLRRRRTAVAPLGGQASTDASLEEDPQALIQAIASLDDRFARGEVSEQDYQRQREALKARLEKATMQGEE
ncbi:MAG: hypothetical protein ACE5IG_02245 [Dehalococcoidia bacterium]